MRITVAALVAAASAAATITACSRDAGDYQSKTEEFIEEDEGLRDEVNDELSNSDDPPDGVVTFEEATCEEPASTDPGTEYRCTAVDNFGATWDFSVEIDDNEDIWITGVAPRE